MEYFNINYDRLRNMHQVNFYIIVIIIILIFLFLLFIANFINVSKKLSFYGVYDQEILRIKINCELSDIIKNNNELVFNGDETTYKINSYGNYDLLDSLIYQEIDLTLDKNFSNNEVGVIELYYDKQKLIKYIFKLFK